MAPISDAVAAGWPLAATLAVVLAGERIRAGRRREALNRALHELRRPLQAVALLAPRAAGPAMPGPLDLAFAALADLDHAINRGPSDTRTAGPEGSARSAVSCRDLVATAVARWRARASLTGGSLELNWSAGPAEVAAEPARLSQAIDNLIVNALEHGGPQIAIEGSARAGRIRIAIADDGVDARPPSRRGSPTEVIRRLSGRRQHGHGLEVVRSLAVSLGGRFAFQRSSRGSIAILELPLAGLPEADAA